MQSRWLPGAAAGVLLAACSAEPIAPPASLSRSGITFAATSEVGTAPPPGAPEALVRTTATVRNTTGQPVTFGHGACVVMIRLYREPARSGTPAWDQGPNLVCVGVAMHTILAPGADTRFDAAVPVSTLHAAGLRPGRYYVGAVVRIDPEDVVLSAGAVELPER